MAANNRQELLASRSQAARNDSGASTAAAGKTRETRTAAMTSASAPITNSGAVRKWGGSAAIRPSTSQPANSARASFSVTTKNARQLGVNSAPAARSPSSRKRYQ